MQRWRALLVRKRKKTKSKKADVSISRPWRDFNPFRHTFLTGGCLTKVDLSGLNYLGEDAKKALREAVKGREGFTLEL